MCISETCIVKDQNLTRVRVHAERHHRHATVAQASSNSLHLPVFILTHSRVIPPKTSTHTCTEATATATDPARPQALARDAQLG